MLHYLGPAALQFLYALDREPLIVRGLEAISLLNALPNLPGHCQLPQMTAPFKSFNHRQLAQHPSRRASGHLMIQVMELATNSAACSKNILQAKL